MDILEYLELTLALDLPDEVEVAFDALDSFIESRDALDRAA